MVWVVCGGGRGIASLGLVYLGWRKGEMVLCGRRLDMYFVGVVEGEMVVDMELKWFSVEIDEWDGLLGCGDYSVHSAKSPDSRNRRLPPPLPRSTHRYIYIVLTLHRTVVPIMYHHYYPNTMSFVELVLPNQENSCTLKLPKSSPYQMTSYASRGSA